MSVAFVVVVVVVFTSRVEFVSLRFQSSEILRPHLVRDVQRLYFAPEIRLETEDSRTTTVRGRSRAPFGRNAFDDDDDDKGVTFEEEEEEDEMGSISLKMIP